MTTFNNEINRIFKEMSRSFGSVDDIFEALQNTNGVSGPIYYGYTMTVGPDGKPVIQEYGNVSQTVYLLQTLVDVTTSHKHLLPRRENL